MTDAAPLPGFLRVLSGHVIIRAVLRRWQGSTSWAGCWWERRGRVAPPPGGLSGDAVQLGDDPLAGLFSAGDE